VIGGLVAKDFHAVAALDERETFGDEPFQFDGADLLEDVISDRL
jgi:hypothetical protein